ncbi:hypothetical protein HY3_01595 [Hyphomonas pacifica]|uniref:Uncharacterized protein n=1 Tax=Hyphomonas pacifica TaxID=1280941 RepID=A0A062U1S5_9PROT|nr:hypothetical protein HY2_01510 [Hyphomonas pacifica]RAN32449.1 hypothetical protein HY11_05105 [Hyphomonas pacifica]RAN34327.1 hypothetical protein HY3_01595 [Hyphomonas pacifica]
MALAVQGAVKIQDWRVDPGALSASGALGTHFHHARKCLIGGDPEWVLLYFPRKAFGNVKAFEGNDPTHVRVDKEQVRVVAGISHREDAPPVTGQQVRRTKARRHGFIC